MAKHINPHDLLAISDSDPSGFLDSFREVSEEDLLEYLRLSKSLTKCHTLLRKVKRAVDSSESLRTERNGIHAFLSYLKKHAVDELIRLVASLTLALNGLRSLLGRRS